KDERVSVHLIFLRAAPAGGSWCRQQERLSRRVHRPLSLVENFAPSGLFMARPLALVSAESLTVNSSRSSEPHPLMPAGAARKKLKIAGRQAPTRGAVTVAISAGRLTP
ncbi:MAG: hypothetical protein MPJ79_02700, partial [Alphaproteobacteria bacterium]|nr:hypothetical protein [Alphaproteobacteria bacterium]